MANNYINEKLPIFIFALISLVYFYFKYTNTEPKSSKLQFWIYIGSIILSQILINRSVISQVCGIDQWGSTFLVTFAPWILIFGVLNYILGKYPGWLKPFSNTIGYAYVSNQLGDAFDKILNPTSNIGGTLGEIYENSTNQNLLINEIPPNDFDSFIKNSEVKKLLNSKGLNIDSDEVKNLRGLVKLKNIVAEFVWYTLSGILTILLSYNYMLHLDCAIPPQQITKNSQKYQETLTKRGLSSAPRTYITSQPKSASQPKPTTQPKPATQPTSQPATQLDFGISADDIQMPGLGI